MKNTLTLSLLLFLAIECNTPSPKESATPPLSKLSSPEIVHRKPLTDIINHYLYVKTALADDENEKAKNKGEDLLKALENLDISLFSAEKSPSITKIIGQTKEHAQSIAQSEIVSQREAFAQLSSNLLQLIALTGSDRVLYKQYCPMYNNNEGGTWLSESEKIINPYFGAQMLQCGIVEEIIPPEK